MKNQGISEKNIVSIRFLCICIIVLIIIGGFLSSGSIDNFANHFCGYLGLKMEPQEQETVFTPDPTSFTIPSIPEYSSKKKELTPVFRTRLQPGFFLRSDYRMSEFFQGGMGYMKISIKNEGRNSIFIERYGISVNASKNQIYSKDCGVLIYPEEEKSLGIIAVKVPEEETASLNIVLWLLAETSQGKWHEYEPYFLRGFTVDLKTMPKKVDFVYQYDPAFYFKKLNQLVEPADPSVRNTANKIARSYSGAYNIYQICAIFDKVRDQIEYVNDPRSHDYWAPANETLKIKGGDCDDKAILLSSMIEAMGGTTRIYLTDTHAFAAVYIGNRTKVTEAVVRGIRACYGNVDVNYLTDKYGSWLMLDPTASLYAGGLPGTTAQVKIQTTGKNETQRTWTFFKTSEVKVIDIQRLIST